MLSIVERPNMMGQRVSFDESKQVFPASKLAEFGFRLEDEVS